MGPKIFAFLTRRSWNRTQVGRRAGAGYGGYRQKVRGSVIKDNAGADCPRHALSLIVLGELDQAGEWYFDPKDSTLYLVLCSVAWVRREKLIQTGFGFLVCNYCGEIYLVTFANQCSDFMIQKITAGDTSECSRIT